MKVLLIGSGGREHVLAWKIKQSPLVTKLYCAPGNGGISDSAECVNIAADDITGLLTFAKSKKIDLTVVGPEAPLVAGIVDIFEREGLKIFGPNLQAAQLEGSKVFAKEMMSRFNVPTAPFEIFDNSFDALQYLKRAEFPLVVKAEGLAAGKGVIICKDLAEGEKAIKLIMQEKVFKEAGERVVVEEFLPGEEASILAISDGDHYVLLDTAQDHKKIFDDDLGPNTGGMGAYSPAPVVDEKTLKIIDARVIEPMIRGMKREGIPFKGVLYAGLILTVDGPMTLEFNVRFGDPEAQAILPRLQNDLVEVMLAACEGRLNRFKLNWDKRSCVCVVMSSGGYPGKYETGKLIKGLDAAATEKDVVVFHAGTERRKDGCYTSGGRVLGVTGFGDSIQKAIDCAYKAVDKITFDHYFFRRDIGAKAVVSGYRVRAASHRA